MNQDQRIEAYKETKVNNRNAHDLLVRRVDSRVLPVTRLPNALGEWREPSHGEFERYGKTAWRLFNAECAVYRLSDSIGWRIEVRWRK